MRCAVLLRSGRLTALIEGIAVRDKRGRWTFPALLADSERIARAILSRFLAAMSPFGLPAAPMGPDRIRAALAGGSARHRCRLSPANWLLYEAVKACGIFVQNAIATETLQLLSAGSQAFRSCTVVPLDTGRFRCRHAARALPAVTEMTSRRFSTPPARPAFRKAHDSPIAASATTAASSRRRSARRRMTSG
jgi:hypothetical protein